MSVFTIKINRNFLIYHLCKLYLAMIQSSKTNPCVNMDKNRFSLLDSDKLCFLCLETASETCSFCDIPYCCQDHLRQHYNEKLDYCYPFRVLQRPEVSAKTSVCFFRFFKTCFVRLVDTWLPRGIWSLWTWSCWMIQYYLVSTMIPNQRVWNVWNLWITRLDVHIVHWLVAVTNALIKDNIGMH